MTPASLEASLRDKAASPEKLSFHNFMREALYAPGVGYYCRPVVKIGPEGDFQTAPWMSPHFGKLLAGVLSKLASLLKVPPAALSTAEFGAGTGQLCRDFLSGPDAALPALVTLFENDAWAREKHRAVVPGKTSFTSLSYDFGSLPLKKFQGLVLANEFLDALPVRRLKKSKSQIEEAFVVCSDRGFDICWQSLSASDDALAYAEKYTAALPEGGEFELCPALPLWLDDLNGAMKKGWVLVIDYGDKASSLYCESRFRGSLKCHHKHRVSEAYFQNIGEQDMTASVNFSFLEDEAHARGFETLYLEQGALLLQLGAEKFLQDPGLDENKRQALSRLINPMDMGGSFKAMILAKDVPLPQWKNFREMAFSA